MKSTLAFLTTLILTGSSTTGAFVICPIKRNRRVVVVLIRMMGNGESNEIQQANADLLETSVTDVEKAVANIGKATEASPFSPELAQAQSEMETVMTDLELALQNGSTEMLSKAEKDLVRAMADMEHAVEIKKQSVRSNPVKPEAASNEQAAFGLQTQTTSEDVDTEKIIASSDCVF